MKINIKKTSLAYLTILAVIMHGAVYWSVYAQESYAVLGLVAVTELLILTFVAHSGIQKWFLVYCVVSASCYFMAAFVNGIGLSAGLNIKTALIYDLNILTILVGFAIDKKKFINYFVWLITVISAISLFFYAVQSFLGKEAISSFFTYVEWGRGHYVNLFYSFPLKDTRNYAVFYEPGVFQILTNSALYILIFGKNYFELSNKKYIISILILCAAILTSGSTTGYINLLLILSGIIFTKGKTTLQKRISMLFFVAVIIVLIDYVINGMNSILSTYVLNKIFETQSSSGVTNYNTSGGARLYMFSLMLSALKQNPLFGIGGDAVNNAISTKFFEGFGTGNGLASLVAGKGLLTAFAIIGPFIYMGYKNRGIRFHYLILLMIYFNTVCAQSPYSIMCCSFVLLFVMKFNERMDIGSEVS